MLFRSVYHVISVEKEEIIYRYGDLENKYVATHKREMCGEPGYKKWSEISKKEFEKKIKNFEDLDKTKEGKKNG